MAKRRSRDSDDHFYINVLGHSVLFRDILLVTLFLAALGTGVYFAVTYSLEAGRQSAIVSIRNSDEIQRTETTSDRKQVAEEALEKALNLSLEERLIYGHQKATGYRHVESLVMEGEITALGIRSEMKVIYKQPNRIRVEYDKPNETEEVFGSDGETVWIMVETKSGKRIPMDITGTPQSRKILNKARIGTYLWEYESGGDQRIELLEKVYDLGNELYVFAYNPGDGNIIKHFIEADSLLEYKRTYSEINDKGEKENWEIRYVNYQSFNNIKHATRIVARRNGELYSETIINNITINPGVPGFIFDLPESTVEQ